MRITSFQEKMKKKTSEFTFQLEGIVDKDGFCDMIHHLANSILTAIWSVEGDLRPFEKITLPPVVQNSIKINDKDNGDFITTIMNVSWSSIKAERDSENCISFILKGRCALDEDQLLAMQRCIRERINLNVHWFDAQQELPLDKKKDDDLNVTVRVNGEPPITLTNKQFLNAAKKIRRSATPDNVQ